MVISLPLSHYRYGLQRIDSMAFKESYGFAETLQKRKQEEKDDDITEIELMKVGKGKLIKWK